MKEAPVTDSRSMNPGAQPPPGLSASSGAFETGVEGGVPLAQRSESRLGGVMAAVEADENFPTSVHAALPADEVTLEIEGFDLWYGAKQALWDVSLSVPRGKVTALIGPSGCGKSTLLRSVNRMNDLIDSVRIDGAMRLNGDPIYGRQVDVIELRKRIGMVFQKPNPFPMSIYENVIYPLRLSLIHI